jgi:hypothetical protein
MVLRALHAGLKMWDESPDKRLPEEVWHVTTHYENIKSKLLSLKDSEIYCLRFKELDPVHCRAPFNSLSEMTPRNNPADTALRHILKPVGPDGYIPIPEKNVYDPPDVFNPALYPPEGEFDYLAIVENGVEYQDFLSFDNSPLPPFAVPTGNKLIPLGVKGIEPGMGWSVDANANPDSCDGSYYSFCGRAAANDCLLYGHNDNRGGLQFDGFSGWGVFTIPNVKLGVILSRLEWWHGENNKRTKGWVSENNETSSGRSLFTGNQTVRRLGDPSRRLGGKELCDDFKFEFAINGKLTSYSKDEFKDTLQVVQRVVQVQYFLNDTSITKNGEAVDVELAIRITGCGRGNMFKMSHIYWA